MKIMLLLSIDWESWITLLAVIAVPYYIYVLVKYFRQEVMKLARWASLQKEEGNIDEESDEDVPGIKVAYVRTDLDDKVGIVNQPGGPAKIPEPQEWQPPAQEIRGLIPVMHDLAIEVRQFGEQRVRTGVVREELIMGLRGIMNKDVYKVLKDAEFEEFVKAMVLISVSSSCSILLDAGELERMWGR
jgi:hypothetical protein